MKKYLKIFFALLLSVCMVFCCFRAAEKYFYPLKYEDIIIEAGRESHISPCLIAAVILSESGFNKESRSDVGAVGLMQLMPETAWWIAENFGIKTKEHTEEALTDPELNIILGAKYIEWLYLHFNLSEVEAIAAYNIGQNEVEMWSKNGKKLEIKDIPVPETRFFVKRVLKSKEKYRRLYPQLEENL